MNNFVARDVFSLIVDHPMPPIRGQNVDGNGMNFMEVVFENMRDLGEPDVEIIRVVVDLISILLAFT